MSKNLVSSILGGSFLALSLVIFGCASVKRQSATSTRTEVAEGVPTGSIKGSVATKKGTPLEALFSKTRVIDGMLYRLYSGSMASINYFGPGTRNIKIEYVEKGYGTVSLRLLEQETRVIDGVRYGKWYIEDPPGSDIFVEVWAPIW